MDRDANTISGSKKVEPYKTLRKSVLPIEVGKYYLKTELDGVFGKSSAEHRRNVEKKIDALSEFHLWRLFEAMSFTYRLNGVFGAVSDSSFDWSEEIWKAEKIILTGIHPLADNVINSPEVNKNPVKFVAWLKARFDSNKIESWMEEFRPKSGSIIYPKLTLKASDDGAHIIDGSHRLISIIMKDDYYVAAYVARAVRKGMKRVGDSTFLLLRYLFEKSNSMKEKEAIFTTTSKLINESSDGKQAIKTYWVERGSDEGTIQAGKKLLGVGR